MKPDLESRVFRRKGNALIPADIHAEEMFATIKDGKDVLLRVFKPRNVEHHRKLFAILNCVVENSETYRDVEELLTIVKIATGLTTAVKGMDGQIYRIPKSISFASMPQDTFERFFKRATYALSQLSGIPESVLLEEIKNEG
jgi:hypothetical protein